MTTATAEQYAERLKQSLPAVRSRIEEAESLAGRSPGSVRLVAVTKAHPHDALEAALAAGLRDLGENRVEELEEKVAHFGAEAATWHMIGHLQSRKARRALRAADLVHSVDSMRLAGKLARAATDDGTTARVLLQVNTSGEESKSGFGGEDVVERIHEVCELDGLEVAGLMTMAPFTDDERALSGAFAGLREVRDAALSAGAAMGGELSMGMTNDLEIAIREGSTMVRIGTALFGERTR